MAGAGRADEAVAAYRLALNSEFAAQAYSGIGRTLSAKRDNGPRLPENFRQAATLDPSNAAYLNNFGYAQLKQNFRGPGLATVVSELQRAHELDPASNLIRTNLALALWRFPDPTHNSSPFSARFPTPPGARRSPGNFP